jgi:hypothetical protein
MIKNKRNFKIPTENNKTSTMDLNKIDINNYDDISKISFGIDSIPEPIKKHVSQIRNVSGIK